MGVTIQCTKTPEITAEEMKILQDIGSSRRYPVANFDLYSSKNEDIYTGAMENVHLYSADEKMAPVVERGEILQQLADKGLITLEYDLKLYVKSDFVIFKESDLFKELEAAVEEAKESDYTFDIAHLTKGMAKLTVRGQYVLTQKK